MKCRNCKYLRWAEEYPGMPFFGWCDEINDSPDMDIERECRCFEPATNADRIRRMSDEELSEWLCQALDCDFCKAYLQNMSIYSCCENQVKGIFDWLQSPAEEDT